MGHGQQEATQPKGATNSRPGAEPRRRVPGGESLAPAVRPAGREPRRARPRPPASWRATTSGAAAETPGRNKQPRVSQRERAVKTGAAGRDGSGGPASSALQGPTPETRTPPAPGFPPRSRGGRAHAPSVSCVPLPRPRCRSENSPSMSLWDILVFRCKSVSLQILTCWRRL